jgi:hypothetical protein
MAVEIQVVAKNSKGQTESFKYKPGQKGSEWLASGPIRIKHLFTLMQSLSMLSSIFPGVAFWFEGVCGLV